MRASSAKDTGRELQVRIAWLFIVFTALTVAVTLRLAYLQLWRGDHLASLAFGQRVRGEVIEPERGRILDRNLQPLAMSVYTDAVYARPERVPDPAAVARRLAQLLGSEAEELERRLRLDAPSVLLAARLDPAVASAVAAAQLPGVYLESRPQRFYPHDRLASHLLGFAGVDNQGLEGLEFHYDELLRGTPGRRLAERDPRGRSIPRGREETIPPVPGHDLVLTIDHALQYRIERRLREAVDATKAAWGLVLAVHPRTGEILVMAQEPGFNPNDIGTAARSFRNRAISDQVEPGSTFKAVIGAIALELGLARPDEVFDGPAELHIGGGRVRCWRYPQGFGLQTFEEALAHSCNTVFAQLGGERIPPAELYRYLRAFGFGDRLGIDLPGEARGHVPVPGQVAGEVLRWANVGFGQGISVTPLQLTMAVAALVNDGNLMRPYVVREVRDAAGRTVMRREPEVIRQVVSSRTAAEMMRALERAVTDGTGSLAAIPGYRVLGKTGTAQIPTARGYGEGRIASFIGAVPADDPQVVALVLLYDVRSEVRYGGQLAAPLFADVASLILEHQGVRPSRQPQARRTSSPIPGQTPVQPPAEPKPQPQPVQGHSAPPQALSNVREGDWWSSAGWGTEAWGPSVRVPDVRGLSMRAAIDTLEAAGLRIRVEGSGLAVAQEPAPGREVPVQTPVLVRFAQPR